MQTLLDTLNARMALKGISAGSDVFDNDEMALVSIFLLIFRAFSNLLNSELSHAEFNAPHRRRRKLGACTKGDHHRPCWC